MLPLKLLPPFAALSGDNRELRRRCSGGRQEQRVHADQAREQCARNPNRISFMRPSLADYSWPTSIAAMH